jgi:hypothetical protein
MLVALASLSAVAMATALVGLFGPRSFRSEFDAAWNALMPPAVPALVGEADLEGLPTPVAQYLRASGVVGRPRVIAYQLRFSGRIRSDPGSPWMPFTADQRSAVDGPTRLFLMRARMRGLPVEAFHHYAGGRATMRVRLAGLVPIADARGEAMDMSESVTVLNDMALLAPATLLDSRISWEAIDDRSARARFEVGGRRVSATLMFGADGLLSDFVSDDRSRASADGRTFTRLRFSTPVTGYGEFGGVRLPAYAEARWHAPEGEFVYGEFRLREVVYNGGHEARKAD